MPTVSIVVPNYNHARFLERRINSLLTQTFQDFELILLDDFSTDESRTILSRFASDPRVRLEFNDKNSGSTFRQWNKGVKLARGQFVWIAESDDYADQKLLQRLVNVLDQNSTVTVAYCQSWALSENDQVNGYADYYLDYLDARRWKTDFCVDGRDECQKYFVFENTIPNASAVVFRKSAFEGIRGADESLRICGDWKMWAGMALTGKVAYLREPLNYYRWHDACVRHGGRRGAMVAEAIEVVGWILRQLNLKDKDLKRIYERQADLWVPALMSRHVSLPTKVRILRNVKALDPHPIHRSLAPALHTIQRKFS